MLLITEEEGPGGQRLLTAQGRLVGPWVEELRRVAESTSRDRAGLVLDLSEVTFVDRDGLRLLRRLAGSGVGLRGMSAYILELLEPERGMAR